MQIRYLKEFICVAQVLNFSQAAKSLFISQSSLSNHIASLEEELGGALFNREVPLSLTHLGASMLGDASMLVQAHDEMLEKYRHLAANPPLELVIARDQIFEITPGKDLRIYRSDFLKKNSRVVLRSVPCSSDSVEEILSDGSVDLVAVPYSPLHLDEARSVARNISFAKIPAHGTERLCLLVSNSSPLAQRQTITWTDIPAVNSPHDASGASRIWHRVVQQIFADHGVVMRCRYDGSGEDFLSHLSGDEIQLFDSGVTGSMMEQVEATHRLVPIDDVDNEAACYVAYRTDSKNPAVELFVAPLEKVEMR